MNAADLLEHYDRIADAPDAIPRLRRFILDLAVHGKLVPQDQSEEPASALLSRIAGEKARKVPENVRRRQSRARATKQGPSRDLPAGWCATILEAVTICLDYRRVPVNASDRAKRIADRPESHLYPYFGATQQQGWIDGYLFDEELILLGEDGVPFFDPMRPKAYLIRGKSWVNNHAHVFRGVLVSNQFLVHCLNAFDYSGFIAGATRTKLNQARAIEISVRLPPLAEQHRIVAKVDELMALCDRLEAARAEREATRDRLTAATLARLNAPDPGTFQADARVALEALPALTTRPDQIKQLRQTILNLAVRGKLVQQDSADGQTAGDLLRNIALERVQLGIGIGKRSEPTPTSLSREEPFVIPGGWQWSAVGDAVLFTQYGTSRKSHLSNHGVPVLSMGNIQDGMVTTTSAKSIPVTSEEFPALYLKRFDILYNRTNSAELVGKVGIYLGNDDACTYASYLIRLRPSAMWSNPRYLNLAMNAPIFRASQVAPLIKKQTGQANVNGSALRRMLIPLPPLAEQHRIVAKVDELMALCDQLDESLTAGDAKRGRLLEALLHEVLTPGDAQERAA